MVDFSKRLGKTGLAKSLDPVAIYDNLDREVDKGPLRPAQAAILNEWHNQRRSERDVVIKLHTGQGKTLIGLLLLQSKINEGQGPSLYICPNKFLVSQTRVQAKQFGIPFCTDDDDIPQEFLDGQKILITHVQKLFNGQTRFKTGSKSVVVNSIVIDDSHACVDSIRDACVIELKKDEQTYRDLVDLFSSALETQGAGTYSDIKEHNYDALLPVPYWVWREKQDEVMAVLSKVVQRPSNSREKPHSAWFAWPLLRDNLINCQCIVSGRSIEIAPYLPPLDEFGSYFNAKHRVFMSATVTNDSFLVRGLRLEPKTIKNPLVFREEKWSGEKMLLLPSLIDSSLSRDAIVNEFAKPNSKRAFGVVALTPSFRAAEFWENCGATVAKSESIDAEVSGLRNGNYENVVVIASRYDGIDLPDASCRILIFDSLPHAANLVDAYSDACRGGSSISSMRIARSIEQGLGRSVRGEKDYSVIILIGPELIKMVRSQQTRQFFSPQTRAQIEIGLEIVQFVEAEDAREPLKVLVGLVGQCLRRDPSWKQFYVEKMDAVVASTLNNDVLEVFAMELAAEQAAQLGDPRKAVETIQELIDTHVKGPNDVGWYLQEMARYAHAYSKVESNTHQISAHRKNRYVMRPATGMVIDKINLVSQKRVENIIEWVKSSGNFEELRLAVEEILGRLEFGTTHERFEAAILDVGRALGFASQRPDREWKEGPDNLWAVRDGEYFLIECKSEVSLERSDINKEETGQMNTACGWFDRNYKGAQASRILIIPTKKLSKASAFTHDVLVMRNRGLRKFTKSVREFFAEFAHLDFNGLSGNNVQKLLSIHELDVEQILGHCEEAVVP